MKILFIILPILALIQGQQFDTISKIHVEGKDFIDEYGRVRIFHGFNDVQQAKGTGYSPGGDKYKPKIIVQKHIKEIFQQYGFNAMRMPMMWSGTMPFENQFDEDYLKSMKDIISDMSNYGIFSILDMHQDVLSSTTGSYDGAPQWVVNKTQFREPYPWPLKLPLSQWGLGYLTDATGQAFQDIYDNKHQGLDAWTSFWNKVASVFKNTTSVIGYELINEPWAGDIFSDPLYLLPGMAGKHNLQPSYDHIAKSIRQQDNETIIFYEPVTWGMLFPGTDQFYSSGFDHVPGGEDYKNRSAFSYHYYCWFSRGNSKPITWIHRMECDKALGPLVFETVMKDLDKLGGGSFLTEFGAVNPNISSNSSATDQIYFVLDQSDKYLQSWTFWDVCSIIHEDFSINMQALEAFSRTYAQAVAGKIKKMFYNKENQDFELEFYANKNIQAPTEIIIPKFLYPNGFDTSVSKGLQYAQHPLREYILLITLDDDYQPGEISIVKISKKISFLAVQ